MFPSRHSCSNSLVWIALILLLAPASLTSIVPAWADDGHDAAHHWICTGGAHWHTKVDHVDLRKVDHVDLRRVDHVDLRRVDHVDHRGVDHVDHHRGDHVDHHGGDRHHHPRRDTPRGPHITSALSHWCTAGADGAFTAPRLRLSRQAPQLHDPSSTHRNLEAIDEPTPCRRAWRCDSPRPPPSAR
ncbi:MAG: hypothetical protein AAF772_10765 [Acidobacteriota bacterium]